MKVMRGKKEVYSMSSIEEDLKDKSAPAESSNLQEELEKLKDRADKEELETIEIRQISDWDWAVAEESVEDFLDLGKKLGAEKFFYLLAGPEDGDPTNLLVFFESGGSVYQMDVVADWFKENLEEKENLGEEIAEEKDRFNRYSKEVTEELKERKKEMMEELREKENLDALSEEERIKIQHGKPEDFRFRELENMKDKIFDAEEANEELEDELSELVYEDDAFNSKFSQLDTETLLKQRSDIDEEDYERKDVRLEMVHRKAKSLLKING